MKKEFFLLTLVFALLFVVSCSSLNINNKPQKSDDSMNLDVAEPSAQPESIVIQEPNKNNCVSSAEKCDGKDNDCNGKIDDGFNMCILGELCAGGRCVRCPLGKPLAEKCDGKDNDCDGLIDEEVRDMCGNCINSNNPKPLNFELCDGKDNDCDGLIDEDEGNSCDIFVCTTAAKFDRCDINTKYKCIDKQCRSTKICDDKTACYWDWVNEEDEFGAQEVRDIRLWAGPSYNDKRSYVCGYFDTTIKTIYSSCEGEGCTARICKSGLNCAYNCYVKLDDSLLRLRKCLQYHDINRLCS
ncbi:MAG TPA: MopE-related protein [Candidatus Nanoarchaeia archaeon]|nr:MopE-related protein [Candidatus Nanoarchaeia archaeon]